MNTHTQKKTYSVFVCVCLYTVKCSYPIYCKLSNAFSQLQGFNFLVWIQRELASLMDSRTAFSFQQFMQPNILIHATQLCYNTFRKKIIFTFTNMSTIGIVLLSLLFWYLRVSRLTVEIYLCVFHYCCVCVSMFLYVHIPVSVNNPVCICFCASMFLSVYLCSCVSILLCLCCCVSMFLCVFLIPCLCPCSCMYECVFLLQFVCSCVFCEGLFVSVCLIYYLFVSSSLFLSFACFHFLNVFPIYSLRHSSLFLSPTCIYHLPLHIINFIILLLFSIYF